MRPTLFTIRAAVKNIAEPVANWDWKPMQQWVVRCQIKWTLEAGRPHIHYHETSRENEALLECIWQ